MSTNPPAREPASPDARQGMCVPAVLFGIVVVFLAQGILGRVVLRAQQGFAPPGSNAQSLAASTLMLPALQVAVCTLLLIPWALLGDRYGPRLPYAGGLLVWALGVFVGSWSGSEEFLLASYALQAAGVAAVLPAALAAVTNAQSYRGGFLTGLVIAFPALLHLPGSLIADLMAKSVDWRAALLLIPVAAIPPLILGWLAIPSGPFEAGSDDDPAPESRPGRGRAVVQTLLFGAVLSGFRIHLELAFSAHHDQLALSGAAGYFRAQNGLPGQLPLHRRTCGGIRRGCGDRRRPREHLAGVVDRRDGRGDRIGPAAAFRHRRADRLGSGFGGARNRVVGAVGHAAASRFREPDLPGRRPFPSGSEPRLRGGDRGAHGTDPRPG